MLNRDRRLRQLRRRPRYRPASDGTAYLAISVALPGRPDEQIPPAGAFVRALLPVSLTGGHTVTFGVWAGIDPAGLQRAFAIWQEPQYADLRLTGFLANRVQPWGLLAAPVSLTVRDPEHTPYCSASPDPLLSRVLASEWPHEQILGTLP
jgi:hypothetical protein